MLFPRVLRILGHCRKTYAAYACSCFPSVTGSTGSFSSAICAQNGKREKVDMTQRDKEINLRRIPMGMKKQGYNVYFLSLPVRQIYQRQVHPKVSERNHTILSSCLCLRTSLHALCLPYRQVANHFDMVVQPHCIHWMRMRIRRMSFSGCGTERLRRHASCEMEFLYTHQLG